MEALILVKHLLLGTAKDNEQVKSTIDPRVFYSSRLVLAATGAGMLTGGYLKGFERGRQFLAENAHRLPRTKGGWFKYHQYKQRQMIQYAGKGAIQSGWQFMVVSAAYATLEHFLEVWQGPQLWNGALAGTGTGLLYVFWKGLYGPSGRYALLLSSAGGCGIGCLQSLYQEWYGVDIKQSFYL